MRSLSSCWFLRVLVVNLLFAAGALAQHFRFVHTSDTHINPHQGPDSNAVRDEALFREISNLDPKPAFAINTGDVVEVGSQLEYGIFKQKLAAMTIPYYQAPGNHDVRWNALGKEGFVKGLGQPLFQHFEHEGVHFFLLDSTVLLEHWGHISQQQLDWLAAELKEIGTAAPVIIGFHHWIGRDTVQVDNEQELIELVDPYNVVLWLQGHGHSDLLWNVNGVPAIMQKGLYQGSYSVIDIDRDKLTITRRSLAESKKGDELVRDKSVPATQRVVWKKVGEWPMQRNRTASAHPKEPKPENAGAAWVTALNAAVQSRLVRTGDALYVTTMAGELARLDPKDGAIKWRYQTGDSVFSAACIDNGVAYIGGADHFVHAVNCSDGSPLWKSETQGAVLAGAAVAKNTVCIGSADTNIYGLDAKTGSLKWKVQGGNLFQSQAATDGERFFVGGWDNYFRCIDAGSGKEIWSIKLGREQKLLPQFSAFAPAITSPAAAVQLGLVYVSTNDGILHALDTKSGDERWRIDRKKMGYSSPLYHDGVVYGCLSEESKVFAADAKTGEIKWEHETGHVVYDSSFCWAGGQVVIGCVDGSVISYNASTGEKAWEYKLDHGHLLASPAGDDHFVYIASMLGRVTAIPISQK